MSDSKYGIVTGLGSFGQLKLSSEFEPADYPSFDAALPALSARIAKGEYCEIYKLTRGADGLLETSFTTGSIWDPF